MTNWLKEASYGFYLSLKILRKKNELFLIKLSYIRDQYD